MDVCLTDEVYEFMLDGRGLYVYAQRMRAVGVHAGEHEARTRAWLQSYTVMASCLAAQLYSYGLVPGCKVIQLWPRAWPHSCIGMASCLAAKLYSYGLVPGRTAVQLC